MLLTALGLLLALLAIPATAGAAIKLGAYYCPAVPADSSCFATSARTLDSYKSQYGRFPDIALNYRNLDGPLLDPYERSALKERGVVPMMTVEPRVGGKPASLQDIANGKYDSYIHSEASAAISYGKEILLRFAHEMNGTWYPWSGEPGAYVAAWRHYVNIFRADRATNVKFVWSPNVNSANRYPFSAYYPEDAGHPGYVNYVGLDGYNWGGVGEWKTLKQVFKASYGQLDSLSGGKPTIIAETASVEEKGKRPGWIRDGFLETIPLEFPKVVAAVWFDRNLAADGDRDWALEGTTGSIGAWQDVVNSPLYGGNVYYLRPNAPRTTSSPWTVVNSESAWQALSDKVTESIVPSPAGYIAAAASTEPLTTEVALDTTSLSGRKVTAASAWFYTPVANGVKLEVRSGSALLATQSFASVGWHALNVPLGGAQTQLNNAFLRFVSSPEAGTNKVYVAFLRLSIDPLSS